MKNIAMLALALLIFSSCDSPPKPSVGTGDFSDFTFEQLDNSEMLLATKRDGSETLLETGYVLNNVKEGMWMTYQKDGMIESVEHFVGGVPNGITMVFDTRGQIQSRTPYKNGIPHGTKYVYRFGRPINVIPYQEGEIHGTVYKFYPNTKPLEEIQYANGVQDGYYRHYNEAGDMDLEYVYANGKKISGGIVENQGQDSN